MQLLAICGPHKSLNSIERPCKESARQFCWDHAEIAASLAKTFSDALRTQRKRLCQFFGGEELSDGFFVLGFRLSHFSVAPSSNAQISDTRQARRPLIRTGRSGPFSRQAHLRRVCGRRLSAAAATSVGTIASIPCVASFIANNAEVVSDTIFIAPNPSGLTDIQLYSNAKFGDIGHRT